MYSIAITTECVADLPIELREKAGVEILYYDIETDTGVFRDTVEMDAENLMEYIMETGGKANSIVPSAHMYKNFFAHILEEYDEVIHLTSSTEISNAYYQADLARAKLGMEGRKVHLVDSRHLSGGMGLMVLFAARLRDEGLGCDEIVARLNEQVEYVHTSFVVDTTDYLLHNGRLSRNVLKICRFFHVHPMIQVEEGQLKLKQIFLGKYKKVIRKYVSKVLGNPFQLEQDLCIMIYSGCSHEVCEEVKAEVLRRVPFTMFVEQPASATVSSNCGPGAFGIIFYKKH